VTSNRFRVVSLLLGLALPLVAFAADEPDLDAARGECPRRMLSEPDGEALACLEPGVPVSVEERVPGWVRIRVEGWIPEEEAALFKSPRGTASLSGSAIDAEGKPAAGAVARLIAPDEALDRSLDTIRERHATSRDVMKRRIEKIDQMLERALFSSDNLYESKMEQVRLRDEKRDLELQAKALSESSAEEVVRLFDQHRVGMAAADASGFFLIEGVQPGSYRLLVISGSPVSGSTWYVPVKLSSGQRQRINLSGMEAHEDPFTSLR